MKVFRSRFKFSTGTVPVPYRYRTGTVPVRYRYRTGILCYPVTHLKYSVMAELRREERLTPWKYSWYQKFTCRETYIKNTGTYYFIINWQYQDHSQAVITRGVNMSSKFKEVRRNKYFLRGRWTLRHKLETLQIQRRKATYFRTGIPLTNKICVAGAGV